MRDRTNKLVYGRRKKKDITSVKMKKKEFSESFFFTLGLAFIIVYIVGLLVSVKDEAIDYREEAEAVAVFAENDARRNTDEKGFWGLFDEALEQVFSVNEGNR